MGVGGLIPIYPTPWVFVFLRTKCQKDAFFYDILIFRGVLSVPVW